MHTTITASGSVTPLRMSLPIQVRAQVARVKHAVSDAQLALVFHNNRTPREAGDACYYAVLTAGQDDVSALKTDLAVMGLSAVTY
jgi:hypothetical protein